MHEKIKVGLGTSTVHPETTAGAFETAAELGYDGVELMVGVDRSSTDINYVESLRDKYQVPVLSVHSPCLIITQNTWSSEPWEKLEVSTKAAKRLGADVVVVHPPFRWQHDYAANFVTGVREVAEKSEVTIAVENMYPWRVLGREILAYHPHWDPTNINYDALTFDLSHAAIGRADPFQMVDEWGSRLRHLHLTDGHDSMMDEHLFPGEGDMRSWEVLEHIVRSGYVGHVIHEISTRKMPSVQARREKLRECLETTRMHIENARRTA